tara:strand:- start:77718 stop:78620 length:903 start_codon:yes stop_codon:yes gene_type:complete
MKTMTLALDWTPNINHIGFFVAREMGFYDQFSLKLDILSPLSDDYTVTPAKKVELGLADFALCPTESIISYQTKSNPFPLVAIAAVLQNDLSAIVTRKDAKINSPKDLDGKVYSSYEARYEDGIVKEMIKNDGGKGELKIVYPKKLGIWNTLLSGETDATWIFSNWEGIEAEQSKTGLNYFKMKDYGIPYSYSPVIAADRDKIKANEKQYKNFLEATKQGFLYCFSNPDKAIEILKKELPDSDKNINLNDALELSLPYFGNDQKWGKIALSELQQFVYWIKNKGLETKDIKAADLYVEIF